MFDDPDDDGIGGGTEDGTTRIDPIDGLRLSAWSLSRGSELRASIGLIGEVSDPMSGSGGSGGSAGGSVGVLGDGNGAPSDARLEVDKTCFSGGGIGLAEPRLLVLLMFSAGPRNEWVDEYRDVGEVSCEYPEDR